MPAFVFRLARQIVSVDQHAVWERIAASFDASRDRLWKPVVEFCATLPDGPKLDLMAGNARHTPLLGRDAVWSDWSRPMSKLVKDRDFGAVVPADATKLPFANNAFSGAIFIAGLHGVPTAEARATCLKELLRVLRPGGRALVSVWSRHAPKFTSSGNPKLPLETTISWRKDGHDESRYYYLYTGEALQTELVAAGFLMDKIEEVGIIRSEAPDNWFATVSKPKAAN